MATNNATIVLEVLRRLITKSNERLITSVTLENGPAPDSDTLMELVENAEIVREDGLRLLKARLGYVIVLENGRRVAVRTAPRFNSSHDALAITVTKLDGELDGKFDDSPNVDYSILCDNSGYRANDILPSFVWHAICDGGVGMYATLDCLDP